MTRPDLGALAARLRRRLAGFRRGAWGHRLTVGGAAATAAVAALLAGAYGPAVVAGVVDHPYFAVSEIVMTPTHHVRAGALLERADLRPGMSLWRIEPSVLGERLESDPWIRRATVRREFPRRLVIDLVEREPAAVLFLDQLYYVDRTGVAFVRVGERDPLDLPFVTGIEAAVVGDDRPFAHHAVRQALHLLKSLQAAGLPFRVSEVHIERERGITVYPIEPRVAVAFGWSGFSSKLTHLARVLEDFRGRERQIREIDLTTEAEAVVRLRRQPSGREAGGRARA